MSGSGHDPLFEAWLNRSSSLHERLAQLDRSEPPEELDRAVLEGARQAVRAPRSPERVRPLRWALPAGLAATLIVSLVLLLQITPARLIPTAAPPRSGTELAEDPALEAQRGAPSGAATPRADASRVRSLEAPPPSSPAAAEPRAPAAVARTPATTAQDVRKSEHEAAARAVTVKTREAWRAEIERLRALGRTEEADRQLAAFRLAYPDGTAPSEARPAPAATAPPDR